MSARDDHPWTSDGAANIVRWGLMCDELDRLRAEVERAHTWAGIMALLDEHWPTDRRARP